MPLVFDKEVIQQTGESSGSTPTEQRFAIIYPNGGTERNPANVTVNTRYILDNPFPKKRVDCRVELLFGNEWTVFPWQFFIDKEGAAKSCGAAANQLSSVGWTIDKIILQTAVNSLADHTVFSGTPSVLKQTYTTLPARILVWRVD